MQRQRHIPVLLKSLLTCFLCLGLFIISPDAISATEQQYRAPLSTLGITDKQFETRVKEYLNIPYRLGGNSPKGMDCSGFSKTVYSTLFGIDLPRRSVDQFRYTQLRRIDTKKLQTGDLIFFRNPKRKQVNHVGIYMSDRRFIHASLSKGVTVASLDTHYWRRRLVGSKRHTTFDSKSKSPIIRILRLHKKRYH